MDKLEEVKALKKLLDEGVIDEEDFARKKSELLGDLKEVTSAEKVTEKEYSIKETNKESISLDDYEKELIEQSEAVEESAENSSSNSIEEYYQKEKAKVRAKLDAEEEMRKSRKAEQKVVVDKNITKAKRVFKWILAVMCWMYGISGICGNGNLYRSLSEGMIVIVLGFMSCPKITDYTIHNPKFSAYTKHKAAIVWILIVLWIVVISMFPISINENNNYNATNNTSVIENK